MLHYEEAKAIWIADVPRSGQATTIRGELLRAVEKLRHEAVSNGNVNWESGHGLLIKYLRHYLLDNDRRHSALAQQLDGDLARVADYEYPSDDDELYDRLADRVVEWDQAHPGPLLREVDPNLTL